MSLGNGITPTLNITGPAMRASLSLGEHPVGWVLVDPGSEFEIKMLQKDDILYVVLAHHLPASPVASHATGPEFVAGVANLLSKAKELTDVIQFVAGETELRFTDAVQV